MMRFIYNWLFLVFVISIKPSCAFFGLAVNGYYSPPATIASSCSNAVTTYNNLRSAISSLQKVQYASLNLSVVAISFFDSYDGLSSRTQNVFSIIQNAATNKSTNTDVLFVQINSAISSALNFIASNNRNQWEKFLDYTLSHDIITTNASLHYISQILNDDLYPELIAVGPGPVTSTTVAASISQNILKKLTSAIDQLRQTEQNAILPSVRSAVSSITASNEKLVAYVSKMSSSFATLDTSLSRTWALGTALKDTYSTATLRLYGPVETSVNTFSKAINKFTDLYLGSSASEDTTAVNYLASSYFTNASSQTSMIVSKLDEFRSQYSDQVLKTADMMLATGFEAIENIGMLMVPLINLPNCASQLIQSFINRYAALLASVKNCFADGSFELNVPLQTQISVANTIQADILYYLKILNGLLTGVNDNSLATARIATDSRITAFFSQSSGIIQTFSQQLVNMYIQLNADYNLLVGRSSYCLAGKNAEANSISKDFVSDFQQCL
ncbi:uncharacterized protein LOC134216141 [Armigeres subalbatus]|uniref:uncharacterized protein LOC134216141 n=1 Tax=Armigeres subalbatus TaxID=124917 RepID=UPI002ED0256E